jgi:hypothetical protein
MIGSLHTATVRRQILGAIFHGGMGNLYQWREREMHDRRRRSFFRLTIVRFRGTTPPWSSIGSLLLLRSSCGACFKRSWRKVLCLCHGGRRRGYGGRGAAMAKASPAFDPCPLHTRRKTNKHFPSFRVTLKYEQRFAAIGAASVAILNTPSAMACGKRQFCRTRRSCFTSSEKVLVLSFLGTIILTPGTPPSDPNAILG